MSLARDSSVLFALDELRCLEEERSGESARAAREQAKRDRDREAEAIRRQQQSQRQSAELLALRERAQVEEAQRTELAARLAEEGARRRALEGQLQRLTSEQEMISAHESTTRRHPALWSMALLGAGALLFWLMPREAESPSAEPVVAEASPVAVEAMAAGCPDIAPVDPSPRPIPVLVEPSPAATATGPRVPRRIREKVPLRPVRDTSSLSIDCDGKGPLCGIPQD